MLVGLCGADTILCVHVWWKRSLSPSTLRRSLYHDNLHLELDGHVHGSEQWIQFARGHV